MAQPPPQVGNSTAPQTRLLEMRRQAHEISTHLEHAKSSSAAKDEAFEAKEDELRKRDLELQANMIAMNTVLEQNIASKERSEKRAAEEAKTAKGKAREIDEGQKLYAALRADVERLERAKAKLEMYNDYLSMYQSTFSTEFSDSATILTRLRTLQHAQGDLLEEQGRLLSQLEAARKAFARAQKGRATQALSNENILAAMRDRLEVARGVSLRLQQGVEESLAARSGRTLELSLALQSVKNLFARCTQGPYGGTIKHHDADAEVMGHGVGAFGDGVLAEIQAHYGGAGAGGAGGAGASSSSSSSRAEGKDGDEDGFGADDMDDDGDGDGAALGATARTATGGGGDGLMSPRTPGRAGGGGGGGGGGLTSRGSASGPLSPSRPSHRATPTRPPVFIAGGPKMRLGKDADEDAAPTVADITGMDPTQIHAKTRQALSQAIVAGAYIHDFEAILRERDAWVAEQHKVAEAKAAAAAAEAAAKAEQMRAAGGKKAAGGAGATSPGRAGAAAPGSPARAPSLSGANLFSPINTSMAGAGGRGVGASFTGLESSMMMLGASSSAAGGGGGVHSSFSQSHAGQGLSPGYGTKLAAAMARQGVRAYVVPDSVRLPANLAASVPVVHGVAGGPGGAARPGGGMGASTLNRSMSTSNSMRG
jgi:hypothetical protein